MTKITHIGRASRPVRNPADFNLLTAWSPPGAVAHRAEIDALSFLPSEALVYERLREIAGAYGKVDSILVISSRQLDEDIDPEQRLYLVDFKRAKDALEASADTGCYVFGYSALAVPVRANRRVKAAGHRYTH
ncbi:MAG: hypothetical protein WCV99_02375 [Sterolibacterium sp.]|jgi:hypothetical protein